MTRTVAYDMPRDLTPPVPEPVPEPTSPAKISAAPAPPPPVLPEPDQPGLTRHRTASELLVGLRSYDARLMLSERAIRRLAPAVCAWLERGVEPVAVQRALVDGLPAAPLRFPAGLIGHRLAELRPPPLPAGEIPPGFDPLQNCERCERAFRAAEPGRCGSCVGPQDDGRASGGVDRGSGGERVAQLRALLRGGSGGRRRSGTAP
ncbi:hypothetical protein [Streptomyces corynorhini]|uniref:hypothetical protein n=1 Tax=Streptomyces corynorhini TaxID=2282652 RepID=UPI0011C02E57|nr:hypothetical protein [Streptomyces corynorhini]